MYASIFDDQQEPESDLPSVEVTTFTPRSNKIVRNTTGGINKNYNRSMLVAALNSGSPLEKRKNLKSSSSANDIEVRDGTAEEVPNL